MMKVEHLKRAAEIKEHIDHIKIALIHVGPEFYADHHPQLISAPSGATKVQLCIPREAAWRLLTEMLAFARADAVSIGLDLGEEG